MLEMQFEPLSLSTCWLLAPMTQNIVLRNWDPTCSGMEGVVLVSQMSACERLGDNASGSKTPSLPPEPGAEGAPGRCG